HDFRRSRALLEALGLRSQIRYWDSAGPLDPKNMAAQFNLLNIASIGDRHQYMAACMRPLASQPDPMIPFVDWWTRPVIKDAAARIFSRLDLVKNVADTDGGAHVDPTLEADYYALSRENSLGWTVGPEGKPLEGNAAMHCMRQIAHEVFLTLERRAPKLGDLVVPIYPAEPPPGTDFLMARGFWFGLAEDAPEDIRRLDPEQQ